MLFRTCAAALAALTPNAALAQLGGFARPVVLPTTSVAVPAGPDAAALGAVNVGARQLRNVVNEGTTEVGDGAPGTALGDGTCSLDWSAAFSAPLNGPVYCMTVWDDGSGPALFIAGEFTASGATSVNRVAKWTGAGWAALGLGIGNGSVQKMAAWDPDGSGPEPSALVVSGAFTIAGGNNIVNLAVWTSGAWAPLPGWNNRASDVYDLDAFDLDGTGPLPPSLIIATPDVAITGEAGVTGVLFWTQGFGLTGRRLRPHSQFGCASRARVFDIQVFDPDGTGAAEAELLVVGAWYQEADFGFGCDIDLWGNVASYRHAQPRGWVDEFDVGFVGFEDVIAASAIDLDGAGAAGPRLCVLTDSFPQSLRSLVRQAPNDYALDALLPLPAGVGLSGPRLNTIESGSSSQGPLILAATRDQSLGQNKLFSYEESVDGGSWMQIGPTVLTPESVKIDFLGVSNETLVAGRFIASGAAQPVNHLGKLSCETACPGDTNGDNVVNFIDLNTVLSFFGQSGSMLPGDLNEDGVVNFLDLNEVLSFFGVSC